MKNLLYVVAGLLFIIWLMLLGGLNATGPANMLPVAAIIIVLIRVIFDKQLSQRKT